MSERSLEEQLRLSDTQMQQRRDLGDDLALPRPIDHSAVFKRSSQAEAAAEQLMARGFLVEVRGRLFRFMLSATRDEVLDDGNERVFLAEVLSIVEANGGEYDGWGGPVY